MEWLKQFGEAFRKVDPRDYAPNSRFMEAFVREKHEFDGSTDFVPHLLPLKMNPSDSDQAYYDVNRGSVIIRKYVT